TQKSLEEYRIIIRDFPETEACRYAMAALANGLLILAEQGDGDGRYMAEAVDILKMFRQKYPKAGELPWVERKLLECKNVQAKKHYETACFYARRGQKDTACRYLAVVLRDHPESTAAADAEKMLMTLDKSFMPGDFQSDKNGHLPKLETYTVPSEAERILIVPRHDNSYLVPVPDLSNKTQPLQEKK
ncbi:MAG: outer membrane protein assembly factor BamD, partial [Lentisphaeria bacterium]|nr:outer membrane protein assembly factor BamD [Lentisphaeria bacterium]